MTRAQAKSLMDLFTPEAGSGRLVSLFATSYELDADFLMTDVLPAALGLGTRRADLITNPAIVDQALRDCTVTVVLDRGSCRKVQGISPRIDIIPSGTLTLHSKLYLVRWEFLIRAIVTSANLTSDGFRKNREVAYYLDFRKTHSSDLGFLRALADGAGSLSVVKENPEATELLNGIIETAEDWRRPGRRRRVAPNICWGGVDGRLIDQILVRWPKGVQVDGVHIVSPFWTRHSDGGFGAIITGLRERGNRRSFDIHAYCQGRGDPDFNLSPEFPLGIREHLRPWKEHRIFLHPCNPRVTKEELSDLSIRFEERNDRSLHAKAILVTAEETTLVAVGSANFTENGLCQSPPKANVELMVVQLFRGRSSRTEAIESLIPPYKGSFSLWEVDPSKVCEPPPESPEEKWPDFVESALLDVKVNRLDWKEDDSFVSTLALRYRSPPGPSRTFNVRIEESPSNFEIPGTETITKCEINLNSRMTAQLLKARVVFVSWSDAPDGVPFPINLTPTSKVDLPVVSIGKRPTEEQLIEFFSDQRDPDDALEEGLGGDSVQAVESKPGDSDERLNQIYTVRSFVECLPGLAKKLHESTVTEKGMRRAFLGELGPIALAKTVLEKRSQGKRSPAAAGFQILELIRTARTVEIMDKTTTKMGIRQECIDRLKQMLSDLEGEVGSNLAGSIFQAFKAKLMGDS